MTNAESTECTFYRAPMLSYAVFDVHKLDHATEKCVLEAARLARKPEHIGVK